MLSMQLSCTHERVIPVAALGLRFAAFRVPSPEASACMRTSIARHGQLTPIVAYGTNDEELEVIDGFKRVHAARELRIEGLRVQALDIQTSEPHAKAAIIILNGGRSLDEIEEAWLVRSLHREDGLTQPEIGVLLGRHKSWVCRRVALAEGLESELEGDLRLGLLSTSSAQEIVRLQRCNQRAVADIVVGRGLTARQTASLVQELVTSPPERVPDRLFQLTQSPPPVLPKSSARPRSRTPAELLVGDAALIMHTAGRLQARLHERPLSAFGENAARLVTDALLSLHPVLVAVAHTIHQITSEKHHASMDHS